MFSGFVEWKTVASAGGIMTVTPVPSCRFSVMIEGLVSRTEREYRYPTLSAHCK